MMSGRIPRLTFSPAPDPSSCEMASLRVDEGHGLDAESIRGRKEREGKDVTPRREGRDVRRSERRAGRRGDEEGGWVRGRRLTCTRERVPHALG